MNIVSYAIHDIIRFQIRNSTGFAYRHFDTTLTQFQNFVADNGSPYDFTVEIGPFARQNGPCVILDNTYHIAEDYIYFRDRRKLSRWEVEISGIEETPCVRIATNFVGNITTPLNIIEFLIQYCLLRKGKSIIHASAVSQHDGCAVFPARSGAGKTTVALSLLDRGFSYLGDNFTILDSGIARSYIVPLNIFSYNRLPILEEALSPKQRVSMFLKKSLYNLTMGYFKVFEKINPVLILGDLVVDNYPVRLVCLLEVRNAPSDERLHTKHISRDHLVKKLRYNMELDLLPFNKCIYSYGYAFPNSALSRFWEMYEETLERNLPRDASYISVEVPPKWDSDAVNAIAELITRYV